MSCRKGSCDCACGTVGGRAPTPAVTVARAITRTSSNFTFSIIINGKSVKNPWRGCIFLNGAMLTCHIARPLTRPNTGPRIALIARTFCSIADKDCPSRPAISSRVNPSVAMVATARSDGSCFSSSRSARSTESTAMNSRGKTSSSSSSVPGLAQQRKVSGPSRA